MLKKFGNTSDHYHFSENAWKEEFIEILTLEA